MGSEVLFYALALLSLFSGSSGQATLQIEGSGERRTVLESMGTTKICVNLTNAMPGDSATFNIQTSTAVANPELYFESLTNVIRTLNDTLTRTCVDMRIVQNGIETGNTNVNLLVRLAHREATGTLDADNANNAMDLAIEIQDTDEVEVGFNKTGYQVTEGNQVNICVDLNSGQILPGVNIQLVHAFAPIMGNGGLLPGSMNFILSNSSSQSCIDFTSGSADIFIDSNRLQTATLMSGEIAVQFSRASSTVEIIDASVATLAIANMTSLEVVEGGFNTTTVVTICLDLISVEGGLRRDIVVNITGNGTATVANNDYSIPIMTLTIPSMTTVGSMSSDYCANVMIIGDDVRELNETILLTFDASPDVFQGPDNVTITILDDGDVNDCTMLLTPANGMLDLNGTELGSVAQYSCNENFRLLPENSSIRTCGPDNWDGVEPQCVIICEVQDLRNGMVVIPKDITFITEGTMISHSCMMNYRLEGNEYRTCQSDGTLSGSAPSCIAVTCPMLGSPANGGVTHSGTSVRSTATYSCFRGFMLEGGGAGGARRVCLPDGTWSGSEPTCNGAIRTIPNGVTLLLTLVSLFSIVVHTCI